jgi:hypothetical protein
MFLHNFLNVLVQIANKMGLQKKELQFHKFTHFLHGPDQRLKTLLLKSNGFYVLSISLQVSISDCCVS